MTSSVCPSTRGFAEKGLETYRSCPALTESNLKDIVVEHGRKIDTALSAVPKGEPRPAISILIPVTFEDRRTDVAFLCDWVGQSCEEIFEVIVVARPGRPDFENAARRILRLRDQYIVAELFHEIEGYAIGADAARGEWLLITENHVRPDVNCLNEVLAFLVEGSTEVGVVNSVSIHSTKIGRAEGKSFVWQMHERFRHDPNHQPLQLRGFAMRRDVFLRHGGLPAQYKTHAPAVLGFRVAKAGLRARLIERAFIGHLDSLTFREFAANIRDTTLGECIFADERRPQFETPASIPWRRGCDWRNVQALLQTAASPGVWLSPTRRLNVAVCLIREAAHYLSDGSFATRARWLAASAASLWSWVRFVLTQPDSNDELVRFNRMWRRIIAAARLEYFAHTAPHAVADHGSATEMAAMYNDQMVGFHGLESHANRSFRWSYPLAEILVAIPATPHSFTIDTQGLRGIGEDFALGLFVNDHRVPPDEVAVNRGLVTFKAAGHWIIPGSPTRITIVTEPQQEPQHADGDRGRRLGLPFFDFRAEAIEVPRAAAAEDVRPDVAQRDGPAVILPIR